MLAILCRLFDVVPLLLEKGANANAVDKVRCWCCVGLGCAGTMEMADALLLLLLSRKSCYESGNRRLTFLA